MVSLFSFRKCQLTVQVVLPHCDDPGSGNVHGSAAVHEDSADRALLFYHGRVHHRGYQVVLERGHLGYVSMGMLIGVLGTNRHF